IRVAGRMPDTAAARSTRTRGNDRVVRQCIGTMTAPKRRKSGERRVSAILRLVDRRARTEAGGASLPNFDQQLVAGRNRDGLDVENAAGTTTAAAGRARRNTARAAAAADDQGVSDDGGRVGYGPGRRLREDLLECVCDLDLEDRVTLRLVVFELAVREDDVCEAAEPRNVAFAEFGLERRIGQLLLVPEVQHEVLLVLFRHLDARVVVGVALVRLL